MEWDFFIPLIIFFGLLAMANGLDINKIKKQIKPMKEHKLQLYFQDVKLVIPDNCKAEIDGDTVTITEKTTHKEEPAKELLTWEEIMNNKFGEGLTLYYINESGAIRSGILNHSSESQHWLNTIKQAEKLRAIAQLMVIADHYNNGALMESCLHEPVWLDQLNTVGDMEPSVGTCAPKFATKGSLYKAYKNNKEIFETALKP